MSEKPVGLTYEDRERLNGPGFLADLAKELGIEPTGAIVPGSISPPVEAEVRRLAVLSVSHEVEVSRAACGDLLRLMATVGRQQGNEFGTVLMKFFSSVDGNVSGCIKAAVALKDDPEVAPILRHMKEALNPDAAKD